MHLTRILRRVPCSHPHLCNLQCVNKQLLALWQDHLLFPAVYDSSNLLAVAWGAITSDRADALHWGHTTGSGSRPAYGHGWSPHTECRMSFQ